MDYFERTPTCEKCGSTEVTVRWHKGAVLVSHGELLSPRCDLGDYIQVPKEHLHCYCLCGFEWLMKTRDML